MQKNAGKGTIIILSGYLKIIHFLIVQKPGMKLKKNAFALLEALKLDIGAFDIKVAADGRFFIMECNSAPGLGQIGLENTKKNLKIL